MYLGIYLKTLILIYPGFLFVSHVCEVFVSLCHDRPLFMSRQITGSLSYGSHLSKAHTFGNVPGQLT